MTVLIEEAIYKQTLINIVSIPEASPHGHYPSPDFIESPLGLKRYRKEILL
jgi:hypothetical protein